MDAALPHRLNRLDSQRLLSWITLSVLAHVVVFSAGGVAPSSGVPYRAPLTVRIENITPEITAPVAVPRPEPEIESQRAASEPSRSDAPTKITAAETPPESAVGLPLPFDTYFSTSDVDVRAEPVNDVLLDYPLNPYYRKIGGVVTVSLFINAQGALDKATVIDAKPAGLFEDAALEAVNKLRFTPARKNGRAVKSRKTIDVVFDPYDDFSKPALKQPNSSAAGT